MDQKEEKYQVLNFQEKIGKKLKLETLKISERLNMQKLSEEHNEALNAVNNNYTTETIEEIEKLHQIPEDKKCDVIKIGK